MELSEKRNQQIKKIKGNWITDRTTQPQETRLAQTQCL